MDQTDDENTNLTAETNGKIVFGRSSLRRLKSDSVTPIKQKSRTVRACQSENRVKKSKKRGRVAVHRLNDFSVELLTEQLNTPQQSLAEDGDKLWQTCFVSLEYLTPNKLELVKTVSSPLLQIKNEISTVNQRKNIDTVENECIADDCLSLVEDNITCQDNDNTIIIGEKTMNETFTLSPDENNATLTENMFSFEVKADQNKIETLSPPLFNSLFEKAIPLNTPISEKRGSIIKKMSRSLKADKSQRLSNNSKISKSFRLSSVTSARTPKISGSKAVQLYDFLTGEQCGSKENEQINPTNSPPPANSTPKILKKHVINSLLKSTAKKQNNVTFEDVPDENVMNKSRVKMPNFALIHQKRFEKMENISDYQNRKSERAKLLLSGGKAPVNTAKQTPKLKNGAIKKELSFNKPLTNICASPPVQLVSPWRVRSKSILKDVNHNLNNSKPEEKKKKVVLTCDKDLNTSATGLMMRKTPFKANSIEPTFLLDSEQIPQRNLFKSIQTKPQTNNLKISSKDKTKSTLTRKNTNQEASTNFKPNTLKEKLPMKEKTGHTRFGFRVPVKISKDDMIKAVSNKSKLTTSTHDVDGKRAVIKGVRSNRRFDLLMQMRLNK